jgi:hypothetical protein
MLLVSGAGAGALGADTLTLAMELVDPPSPRAVSVYVVVEVGETVVEPEVLTGPTPLILTSFALAVLHVRVED